jgi:hypothetical protein
MRTLFLSFCAGVVTGVISFFISIAFLCFVLLIAGAIRHDRPDMTLTFRIALPVAIVAAISGFIIILVRSLHKEPIIHK